MIQRLVLVLCLAWIGGIAGLSLGALVTPAASGLAGPAIVFWYGVIGTALGLLSGGLAAWKLSPATISTASTATAVVALLVAAGVVAVVVSNQRARSAAGEQEAASARAPFEVSIVRPAPDDGSTFVRISVDGASGKFEMTDRRKPGHPVCRGSVGAAHRLQVLDAIRRVDDLVARDPDICSAPGQPLMSMRWILPERSATERTIDVTLACSAAHGEFTALYVPVEGIAFTADLGSPGLACDAVAEGAQP